MSRFSTSLTLDRAVCAYFSHIPWDIRNHHPSVTWWKDKDHSLSQNFPTTYYSLAREILTSDPNSITYFPTHIGRFTSHFSQFLLNKQSSRFISTVAYYFITHPEIFFLPYNGDFTTLETPPSNNFPLTSPIS